MCALCFTMAPVLLLQAQHPCEVVWHSGDRPEPLPRTPPSDRNPSPLPAGLTGDLLNGGSGR